MGEGKDFCIDEQTAVGTLRGRKVWQLIVLPSPRRRVAMQYSLHHPLDRGRGELGIINHCPSQIFALAQTGSRSVVTNHGHHFRVLGEREGRTRLPINGFELIPLPHRLSEFGERGGGKRLRWLLLVTLAVLLRLEDGSIIA